MALLSREQILSKTDLPARTVEVPEWGGEVLVRVLKGSEKDAFELWRSRRVEAHDGETPLAVRARLVALAACDERREPIFRPADVEELGELSAVALDRVFDAALCLNCMDLESQEQIRKNSRATPGDAGCTASPANSAGPPGNSSTP